MSTQGQQSTCTCPHLLLRKPLAAAGPPAPGSTERPVKRRAQDVATVRKTALQNCRRVFEELTLNETGAKTREVREGPSRFTRAAMGAVATALFQCGGCCVEDAPAALLLTEWEDLHVCLQCKHKACRRGKHMERHFISTNHFLAVNASTGDLFCFLCGDYVYDVEFELVRKMGLLSREEARPVKIKEPPRTLHFTWKHLENPGLAYATWGLRGLYNLGNTCYINAILQALLHNPLLQRFFLEKDHRVSSQCPKSRGPAPAVCLACEIQDLFLVMFCRDPLGPALQTPSHTANGNGHVNGSNGNGNGNSKTGTGPAPFDPLVPHRLLQAMWSHASGEHLAGYEQQDSHEFLLALLDGLHTDLLSTPLPPQVLPSPRTLLTNKGPQHDLKAGMKTPQRNALLSPLVLQPGTNGSSTSTVQTYVHAVFRGTLRSDVTCGVCKSVSTVYEPFLDLSLPLEKILEDQPSPPAPTPVKEEGPLPHTPADVTPTGVHLNGVSPPAMVTPGDTPVPARGHGHQGGCGSGGRGAVIGTRGRVASGDVGEELTIAHCLEAYTAVEMLSEPYNCEKCGCARISSKQLTLHRLPNVLVLHLKRFDARRARKIDRFVRFPIRGLNMADYVYRWRAQAEKEKNVDMAGVNGDGYNSTEEPPLPEIPYDLIAVVEHTGASLQQGHYRVYVQEHAQWFACNDAWVQFADPEDIAMAQGYLLFYMRRGVVPM